MELLATIAYFTSICDIYIITGQFKYQGWEYSGMDVDEEDEDLEADAALKEEEEEEQEAEAEV